MAARGARLVVEVDGEVAEVVVLDGAVRVDEDDGLLGLDALALDVGDEVADRVVVLAPQAVGEAQGLEALVLGVLAVAHARAIHLLRPRALPRGLLGGDGAVDARVGLAGPPVHRVRHAAAAARVRRRVVDVPHRVHVRAHGHGGLREPPLVARGHGHPPRRRGAHVVRDDGRVEDGPGDVRAHDHALAAGARLLRRLRRRRRRHGSARRRRPRLRPRGLLRVARVGGVVRHHRAEGTHDGSGGARLWRRSRR